MPGKVGRPPGNGKTPGSGRAKGTLNRKTAVATEFAQSFLEDKEVQAALASVLKDPKHEHWKWAMEWVGNYGYGKPIERREDTVDSTQHVELLDFRSLYDQPANGATSGDSENTV